MTEGHIQQSLFREVPPLELRRIDDDHEKTSKRVLLRESLRTVFGFQKFREHQEEVCLSASLGHDLLLVMPTGAGKSLCYQLPTIASVGGRALIITPLVALMEDQALKLQALGIRAERIHAGRDRIDSREACVAWRDGHLKLLFVSPERLAVPSFMEFLEKHKPTTIAVDEAHCISCWGHDFRSDYRMLGPRLARLRPANIIAVTATATSEVQRDIVEQLHLKTAQVFVHGFRRTNIAIEVMSMSPGARTEACRVLLKDASKRPAIIYAPTRKGVEALAAAMGNDFRVGAFHAGLPSADRQMVQGQFLRGEIDVMVATIAFGMGIDKSNIRTVIHTAMPSSLEGYYQEIGRAGRDGGMSEAVLMYSPGDMKTHEYFFELNYPDVSFLEKIYAAIPTTGIERIALMNALNLGELELNPALEKLWVHGGITVDQSDTVRRCSDQGKSRWVANYVAQRKHKHLQLVNVLNFTQRSRCRMLQFLDHFGDRKDLKVPCKICDICLGSAKVPRGVEAFSAEDRSAQTKIMRGLQDSLARTFGQMFNDLFGDGGIPRRQIEELVEDLSDQGLVKTWLDSFEKDGKKLSFRWVSLTDSGRVWLHQAGHAPTLVQQHQKLQKKKTAATKRRNQKRFRGVSKR